MAVKRTVTKSKKDGVKKKTVTVSGGKYRNKLTATRSKTKSEGRGKKKSTTVTNRLGRVVASSEKEKGGRNSLIKEKKVNLGRGVSASSYAQRGTISYGVRSKERSQGPKDNLKTKSKTKKNVISRKRK
jgi:hypothetical protein